LTNEEYREPSEYWHDDAYKIMDQTDEKVFLTFLRHPVKVTKAMDTERGVIIASDYAKILTRDSNILQKIFQVLQLNRLDYPDVTKKSLN